MLKINFLEPEDNTYCKQETLNNSVAFAKQIIGVKYPVEITRRPDGYAAIFSEHFINAYRKALTLNCVAEMTKIEKELYFQFLEWSNDRLNYNFTGKTFDLTVMQELDQWTLDELMGSEHPNYITCGD